MKRSLSLFCLAAAVAVFAPSLAAQSAPELAYDAVADAITLPALGEVVGVATNSKGNLYVLARTGTPYATLGHERTFYHGGSRLFQFDPKGKFVREIGQGIYSLTFAQQVRVDAQDNVWAVDAGTNILTKFDPTGQFLMVIGRKPESINVRNAPGVPARTVDKAPATPPAGGGGGEGGGGGRGAPGSGTKSELFDRPSDVAFDAAGNVYIADGMGADNRIAVFNKEGNWLRGWGQTGSGQGQFKGIHGIVSDAAGNLYVADAGNNRIQVFDGQGTFKSQITGIGSPQALCITSGPTQVLYSSNSNDAESMDGGEIYKVSLTGQVLGKFGKAGRLPKEFGMVNALDCRSENELWVGEIWNWRAQKVTIRK